MFDGFIEATSPYMLWVKAAHVFAVMSWWAGMMYLPRLFVYHTETRPGSAEYDRFVLMERKLMRIIVNPAMIATWVFGLWLASVQGVWGEAWFHAKLFLVVVLSGIHGMFSRWRRDFEAGRNTKSQRFFRIVNEIPAVITIAIVILVVVKPF
jgi:protoporphyrinogen IX oxidase